MPDVKWRKEYQNLTKRLGAYSAQPALEESTVAAGKLLERPTREALEETYASMGAGRRGTGFGAQTVNRQYRDIQDRFMDTISSRALSAQQLELQARGLEGDLISGGWDRKTAAKNRKRKARGGLLGAAGAVTGNLLGGPLGAYLGGQLGGAVGQYL
jgi:hypothetical protein